MAEASDASPQVPGKAGVLLVARLIDRAIGFLKTRLNQKFFESSARLFSTCGHWALLVAAAAGLIYALIVAIKTNTFSPFGQGLGWVLLLLVLQYTAVKFLDEGSTLVRWTPSKLSSGAFMDCYALLAFIVGWIVLIVCLVKAIKLESLQLFWMGLSVFVLCEYLAVIAANPDVLNIAVDQQVGAGEEATGILSFLLKTFLRVTPMVFGAGLAIGAASLLIAIIRSFDSGGMGLMELREFPAAPIVVWAAAMPLVSFVAFLLTHLGVDVVRAILAMPQKLDGLFGRGPGAGGEKR